LVRRGGNAYGQHASFAVADFVDGLPGDRDDEIDIEGLSVDEGYLWLVGSHGLTRDKPKRHEKDAEEAMKRLTEVDDNTARQVLARIPLVEEEDGVWGFARTVGQGEEARTAAVMKTGKKGSILHKELRDDVHIGRFLAIPCKENGFDIEGIAARGSRVFLGLRGPVLRGWATILELDMKTTAKGEMKPRKIGADGPDLLILAGPTMDLSSPARLYRWPMAWAQEQPDVITSQALAREFDLPVGEGVDHPEGIAFARKADGSRDLVAVYDSPAAERLQQARGIWADVFAYR
jgi:hypothetical protein